MSSMNRRMFLLLSVCGAVSKVCLQSGISRSVSGNTTPKQDQTKNIGIRLNFSLNTALFSALVAKLILLLNQGQDEFYFFRSGFAVNSKIFITSPNLHNHTLPEMLFLGRVPGGLCRMDLDRWLRSDLASEILIKSYESRNLYPLYLGLGPPDYLQVFDLNYKSQHSKSSFITSNKFSWRRLNPKLEFRSFKDLESAWGALGAHQHLSMEPLQGQVLIGRDLNGLHVTEDTLSCSPAIYQALIRPDFWQSIGVDNQALLRASFDIISKDLTAYFLDMRPSIQNLISKGGVDLPENIHLIKSIDREISVNFFDKINLSRSQYRILDAYNSFRSQGHLGLS